MRCERARELAGDLLDGRLTPRGDAELREHAASCPGCSTELARAEAFLKAMVASFRAARPQESLEGRVLAALPDSPPRRAPRGLARLRWTGLAAGALAAAAASFLAIARRPTESATPTELPTPTELVTPAETVPQALVEVEGALDPPAREEAGSVTFGRIELRSPAGVRFIEAAAGQKLLAGDVVRAVGDGPAELELKGGVGIILDAGGEIVVAPDAARPRGVELTRGQLFAQVEKGPEPFRVLTRLGVVTTLGTEFCVGLDEAAGEEGALAVAVAEGAVQVDRAGVREVVTAGSSWLLCGRRAGCERADACRRRMGWVEQFRRRRRGGGGGEGAPGPGARDGGRERRQGRRRRSRDGQSNGAPERPKGARHGQGR